MNDIMFLLGESRHEADFFLLGGVMKGAHGKSAAYSIGIFVASVLLFASPSLAQREHEQNQSKETSQGSLDFGNWFADDDPCQAYRDKLSASDDYFSTSIGEQLMRDLDIVGDTFDILLGRKTAEHVFRQSLDRAGATMEKSVKSYLDTKIKSGVSQTNLSSAIDADARKDQQEIQRARQAAQELTQCRQQQIATLESDYQANRISREELIEGLEDVSEAAEEDDRLKEEVLGHSRDRIDTFAGASAVVEDVSTDEILGSVGTWSPSDSHSGYPETLDKAALMYTTNETVNVRKSPSTQGAKVGTVRPNDYVQAVGRSLDGQWLEVRHGSGDAYVFASMFQCVQQVGGLQCPPGDPVYKGFPQVPSGSPDAPPPAENGIQAAMIEQKQAEAERQAQLEQLEAELQELEEIGSG